MPTIAKQQKRKRDYKHHGWGLEAKKFYNTSQWIKLRDWYKQIHPICERCLENNIIKPTQEIHHIHPLLKTSSIEELYEVGLDESNLRALCSDCHHAIHNELRKHKHLP